MFYLGGMSMGILRGAERPPLETKDDAAKAESKKPDIELSKKASEETAPLMLIRQWLI